MSDDRKAIIHAPLDKSMRLIEIGASHNPTIPKADGWQTTVVDHAPAAELREKYAGLGVPVDRVEEVDVVWAGGRLEDAVPAALHGSFDGLVTSHVVEHIPDLIGFFQSASTLLKPSGMLAMAVPDRRFCFNFFQPPTLTGDLMAAFASQRTRHAKRTIFNEKAYNVNNRGIGGWGPGRAELSFTDSLKTALVEFETANEAPDSEYRDSHCWYFTPAGFELVVLELNHLGIIPWWVQATQRAAGVEFYTWMVRRAIDFGHEADFNCKRMQLLKAMVLEAREQIEQLV